MNSNLAFKKSVYALIVSLGMASPIAIAAATNPANAQVQNATTVKLAQVKGRVMVNTGMTYTQASSGTLLQTGAKLVTPRGASAVLVYKDGCVKKVAENSMLTIGNSTECSTNAFKEKVHVAAAVGDTVTDTPAPLLSSGAAAGPAPSILAWSAGVIGMAVLRDHHNHHNNPAVSLE